MEGTSSNWETIRANWTRRTVTSTSEHGDKNAAAKLVANGNSGGVPVLLEDVVTCLIAKWEEEGADEGAN